MLTRLKVQNYKSLRDIEILLKPLTVFVGPNNAGKSNILDCLLFIRDLAEHGAPAVHSRWGFPYIVWGGAVTGAIAVELDAVLRDQNGNERHFEYKFEIAGSPIQYAITRELLFLRIGQERKKLLEFPEGRDNIARVWDEEGKDRGGWGGGNAQLYVCQFKYPDLYPLVSDFGRFILTWAFYDLVPSRMKEPNPARKELRLQPEGENLSAVLHSYQSEYSSSFGEVETLLKTGLPEVQRLLTALTEQGQTYVALEEKGLSFRIPVRAMSDGTVRLLGYLAAVYSPEAPSLACFEEPENCIHPHLLEQVIDVLKASSKRTQVLITTHSPYLLNFLRSPESLIVVEKVDGKTVCKAVKDQEGVKEALEVLGLGELWYSGNIGGVP